MRINKFNRQADTCARFCAIAVGFSIPVSVALDNILLVLLLVSWLASGDFRGKFAAIGANPVALAAPALFGLLVLGLAYGTPYPDDGLRYLGKYLDLLLVPVFLTVFQSRQSRSDALKAFGGAILLCLIVSHLANWGLLIFNPVAPHYPDVPGGFKYSITHGLLVGFSAFTFALLAREETRRGRRMILVGLALVAAHNVLFVVFSRTGYLVVAALMLYYFVASFRWRGLAMAGVLGIAVFFTTYLNSEMFSKRINEAITEISEWHADEPSATSVGMRMEFFRGSLDIVREHPLFGAGTGSFPAAYAATVSGKKMEKTVNPHNEFLLIATQIGLVGLACLVYLFYLQWRLAAELAPLYRDLARGLVLTMVIGCMFNSLLLDHTEGLWFAWASGLLFAGLEPHTGKKEIAQ